MRTLLVKVGVALLVLSGMWLLLLAVGSTGQVGGVEVTIWIGLLVATEVYALAWVGRRLDQRTA